MAEADGVTDWLTLVVSVAGASLALFQYHRNSEEQKRERRRIHAIKAADEMEFFNKSPEVRTAQRLLEWESGYISIPRSENEEQKYYHSSLHFCLALRHHETPRSGVPNYNLDQDHYCSKLHDKTGSDFLFSPQEQYIRDVFDTFLGRLERLESLIRNDVISKKAFQDHFEYWFEFLDENDSEKNALRMAPEKRQTFWNYVRFYKFNGVIRLFALYDRTRPATNPQAI